jgi:hypothetical protein
VHLAVHSADAAVRLHEKGGVVIAILRLRFVAVRARSLDWLDLIAPDEQRRIRLTRESTNPPSPDEVALEQIRRRRLRPDDEGGAAGDCLTGHLEIALGDLVDHPRIPFLTLLDVALQHRDPHRLTLARQARAGNSPRAPTRRHQHEQQRAADAGPPAASSTPVSIDDRQCR